MKNSLRNILAISVLLFVACTSDEEERAFQTTVLTIPFAVFDTSVNPLSESGARSTGDPGVMEKLPAPRYLYIWVTEGNRILDIYKNEVKTSYEAINTSSSFWDKKMSEELLPERWEGKHTIDLGKDVVLADGATVQVYAIAAQHQLEEGWLSGIDSPTKLKTLTFSLASWQNSSPVEHSEALGNLYSTPLALMGYGNDDATAAHLDALLHNGSFTVHKAGFQVTLTGTQPVRLYHCAAKADFKWEVVEDNRPGVKMQSITLSGLPTQLKVFEPTHNPAGTATCSLLAPSGAVNPLTDDNCWLGREYAYILQPPTTTRTDDGKLTYTVTFEGRPDKNTLSDQTTSPATNPVFTTWYRINADIR